jgi:hypothetical protein
MRRLTCVAASGSIGWRGPDAWRFAIAPESHLSRAAMSTEYPSTAVAAVHPARLAAAAIAHGLMGDFTNGFRYLELGCGDASNLLPLASRFPEARFVGVDKDRALIDEGERLRRAAGLDNLVLHAADLLDFELGADATFDFVVAHGVYSWVPAEVQERLLALCRERLSPTGVAYVSYNVLPGWGLRGAVSELMRSAARHATTPTAAVRAAKTAAARLGRSVRAPAHPYAALLAVELELIRQKPDGYLLRDHMAERNEPLYVGELARRAAKHGLVYLDETLPLTAEGEMELGVPAELMAAGVPRVDAEQYLDIAGNRQFRGTLLCREGASFSDLADTFILRDTGWFAANLVCESAEPLLGPGKPLGFRTPRGAVIGVDRPLLKAALLVLSASYPGGLRARELVGAAMGELRRRGLLDEHGIDEDEVMRTVDDLVELTRRRHVELLPWTPRELAPKGRFPEVPLITRLEVERRKIITSSRHEAHPVDDFIAAVVALLDGSRDLDAVAREIASYVEIGELALPASPERPMTVVELVASSLRHLQNLGLLSLPPANGAETEEKLLPMAAAFIP